MVKKIKGIADIKPIFSFPAKKPQKDNQITIIQDGKEVHVQGDSKTIDRLTKEWDNPKEEKYIIGKANDVAEELGITQEEINKLIQLGELVNPPKHMTKDSNLDRIIWASFMNLRESSIPILNIGDVIYKNHPEFKGRLESHELEKEISRFNPEYKDGLGLIRLEIKHEKTDEILSLNYSKKELDQLLKKLGEETLKKVRWGSELVIEGTNKPEIWVEKGKEITKDIKERKYEEGYKPFKHILEYFNLKDTKANRIRFLDYYDNKIFNLEDVGIIPSILERHTFKSKKEKDETAKYLRDLYRKFYSTKDIENEDISQVKGRKDIVRFGGFIELVANIESIVNFRNKTINSKTLLQNIFDKDLKDYFKDKDKNLDIVELIKDEASLYSNKELELLEPIMVDGKRKYHKTDSNYFKSALKEKDLFSNIELGIKLKLELDNYKKASRENISGLTIKQIADKFRISKEKAGQLGIFTDVGFIEELGIKTKRGYNAINEFYQEYLKDKVEGFNDETLMDLRTDEKTLEKFIEENLKESKIDLKKINKELKRQYKIDSKNGKLLTNPEPFYIEDKLFYTKEEIAEIEELLKDEELRKRIEWSIKLKEFYENPDIFTEYVKLDTLKETLGLNKEDWGRLKSNIVTENPAVKKIEKTHKKSGKRSLNPKDFDEKYFKNEYKEYMGAKYARNFKTKFYQPKTVAHALTEVEAGIDTLIEESEKLGISLEELMPYSLDTEDKKGKHYLKDDITKLKNGLNKGQLKKLQIALGLSARIDETRDKVSSNYETLDEAAKTLNISIGDMGRYIERGSLKVGGIGIVSALRTNINKLYNTNLTDNDIIDFCKDDPRYEDIRVTKGITNLDEFIKNTKAKKEAQEQLFGEGWLAEEIFEYCVHENNKTTPPYLKIRGELRIHESDIDAIKRYQEGHLSLDVIKREIGLKLTGTLQVIPKQYGLQVKDRDKETIKSLTEAIEEFKKGCLDRSNIETELGVKFQDNSVFNELIESTAPRNIVFQENKYHSLDIKRLKTAIENTAAKLGIAKQKAVLLSNNNYINIIEGGISEEEITRLNRNAHSQQNLADISNTLSQKRDLSVYRFRHNQKDLFIGQAVAEYVKHTPLTDITKKGIEMLAKKSSGWDEYISQEINGKSYDEREKIELRIIRYLMDDLNINPESNHGKNYTGIDFTALSSFQKLLQENDVHRINKFKKEWKNSGLEVDPENSYYTRKELTKILGIAGNNIDRTCINLNLEYFGKELSEEGSKYNKPGLYSLDTAAAIARNLGDEEVKKLNDPLEALLMHKLKLNNNQALNALQIRFNESGSLIGCNAKMIDALGDFFKIGGDYGSMKNSMCYQKIDSAFRNLRKIA